MTVLSPTQIVGMALPPLAPSSSGPVSGSNIGTYAGTDWQYAANAKVIKNRKERKAALAKAREKVEARPETKAERLQRTAKARETGSEAERRETRATVAKAMEKVAPIPGDGELVTDDVRETLDRLRQRYPGRNLADMVKTAEETEAAFKDDPVAAREMLISRYSRMPIENLPEYKEPQHEKGLRGSLRRARQDQANAEELRAAQEKYSKGLPQILKQIEAFDRGMIENPADTSARMATAYGAPAVESDVPAYQAKQAVKEQQKALQEAFDSRCRGVQLAIEHGHIPGDEDTLNEIAEVLQHPRFQFDHSNMLGTLQRAAKIATHPDHQRISPRKGEKAKPGAGSKSISGAPRPGQRDSSKDKGSGTFRDSIARVRAAL